MIVVGVAEPGFVGPDLQSRDDVFGPTALVSEFSGNPRSSPNTVWLSTLARLQPDISLTQANARLRAASGGIEGALPRERANRNAIYQVVDASRGFDGLRTRLRDPLLILMGAVTLVLLVACANLANLLLARGNERRQEFAIKLSLGITRRRLTLELLLEATALALAGGVLGFLLSIALTRFLLAVFNTGGGSLDVRPDQAVLLYTFGGCLLTALLAGLYPAWDASRTDAAGALQTVSRIGRSFVRRGLIIAEVSLAVVLLFGASLFTHSLRNLKTVNLGYDIDRILTVELTEQGPTRKATPLQAGAAFDEILNRVRRLPGVEAASVSEPAALSIGMMMMDVAVTDPRSGAGRSSSTWIMFAGPGYFSTLHFRLLRGRDFTAADRRGSQPVVIVNQLLASKLWPGRDPIGQHMDGWGMKNLEVVGVVADSKYNDVRQDAPPTAYQVFEQGDQTEGALEIRFHGSAGALEREVGDIVRTSAPEYQVSNASSMERLRDTLISRDRMMTFLSSLFGVLGTALALVGIYGLVAGSVARRTREIGIRMSVGARPANVLWLFVRESLVLIGAGALIGLPLALMLARTARAMLYRVSPADPVGTCATLVLLAAGGLVAAYVPSRRATRIDPVHALRWE